MILERTLKTAAAAGAVAAAAAVAIVAAAFALYALLRDSIGPAGAAAVVACVFAVIAILVALFAARSVAEDDEDEEDEESFELGLITRAAELVRDRPLMSVAAAVAAGLFAWKNPQLAVGLAKIFLDPKADPPAPPKSSGRRSRHGSGRKSSSTFW